MKPIASEKQAEQIGMDRTGGAKDEAFTVFSYIHKPSKLTMFGVQICRTGETIAVA